MKLNDIFTRNVVTAGPEETLAAVALRMQEHNVGTVVVVENQRPVGIVTDRDLVPVASPDRLAEVRRWCDEVVCLLTPEEFWAIGQFYEDFTQVEDEEVIELLREFTPTARRR
jgi:predicted phosphoribosyltransferase